MLVDDNLQLSKIFGFQAYEPGVFIVAYVTCTLWQLLDAALDDEDLLELTPEKKAKWPTKPQDVSIIGERISNEPRVEHSEKLHKMNTKISVEIIGHFLRHKVISRLLCLARENMYELVYFMYTWHTYLAILLPFSRSYLFVILFM